MTELLKVVPAGAAIRGADRAVPAVVAAARPAVDQDVWAGVKTLLEVGFAVIRVVEIAILFA
jgi:hypothetical protein